VWARLTPLLAAHLLVLRLLGLVEERLHLLVRPLAVSAQLLAQVARVLPV
jgi:hypothetical protein